MTEAYSSIEFKDDIQQMIIVQPVLVFRNAFDKCSPIRRFSFVGLVFVQVFAASTLELQFQSIERHAMNIPFQLECIQTFRADRFDCGNLHAIGRL